jgi:hypothetical protein
MVTERLNRRNKAGLFLTVVATAACLIAGVAWKESVGVALLGLALTWLIGAIRPMHLCWVASVAGLLLASGSVGWQYDLERKTYGYWRSAYDSLPDTAKYAARDPKTGQNEYWDEIQQRWLRLDQGSGSVELWNGANPAWSRTPPGRDVQAPPEPGWELGAHPPSLTSALHEERTLVSVGLALFAVGFVGIWFVRGHTIKGYKTD